MELEVIFNDGNIVAINKPHGMLVHRSKIAADVQVFALQLLRNQLDMKVYPIHRLDSKTGGLLMFALSEDVLSAMSVGFANNMIKKTYMAIVRGHTLDSGIIDYPLKNLKGKIQDAVTNYETVERFELNIPFGKHSTSRYSIVKVQPQTGRTHQIRKHFAHIFHPIIGDRPYGCNKQNRFFLEKWQMNTMLLHASELEFIHPISKKKIIINANYQPEFIRVLSLFLFYKNTLE